MIPIAEAIRVAVNKDNKANNYGRFSFGESQSIENILIFLKENKNRFKLGSKHK